MDPPPFCPHPKNYGDSKKGRRLNHYGGSVENISILAIDLAKNFFHLRGVNHRGRAMVDLKLRRDQLADKVLSMPKKAVIAMEACGGAHFWARKFSKEGFTVQLIAPQFVKPFVKSQKNDRADAEAIAEAASRASMRTVAVKTEEQQEIQAIHRIRQRLVVARTSLMNEVRGLVAEFGFVFATGEASLNRWLAELNAHELPNLLREALRDLNNELDSLNERIADYTAILKRIAKENPICKRLMTIPGIGVQGATGLYSAVGDGRQFKNGRALAAFLGLVPRQFSTGGRVSLGRITKRGDNYLRGVLVHGARSVVRVAAKKTDPYNLWVTKVREQRGYNRATVALANRNARIAWALMVDPESQFQGNYRPESLLH